MEEDIKIKLLTNTATVPTYGSKDAAGADLYADIQKPLTILPGETVFVKTGIALAIPKGLVGLIFARSGLSCKRGLAPANKVGVIDSDYRGEIMVALHNHCNKEETIDVNERIAQIAFIPFIKGNFALCDDLDDTDRGNGGFGSTGKK